MKSTSDPRHNIAYIRFQEKTGTVDTVHVSDELNVDMAPDGTVYGIELLNANEQLSGEDQGKLIIVNEASDEQSELPLDISPPVASVREKPTQKYGK